MTKSIQRGLTWTGALAWVTVAAGIGAIVGLGFRTLPLYLISPWTGYSDLLVCAGPAVILAIVSAVIAGARRPRGHGRPAIAVGGALVVTMWVFISMLGSMRGRAIEECAPIASGGADLYECKSNSNSDGYFVYCTARLIGSLPIVLLEPCEERRIGE